MNKIGFEFDVYNDKFAILPFVGISWGNYDRGVYFVWMIFFVRFGDK